MKKKEIIDFLRSYGIYEQCDGFDYLIEVIDYAVKNREFNVAKIISIVAKKYGKTDYGKHIKKVVESSKGSLKSNKFKSIRR